METFRSLVARVERAFSVLGASRARAALSALAVTALVFVPACLAWVPNGVYDDWSISNALSGNWGADEGLCLFLNAALSQAVYVLNAHFPSVNWFFMLERIYAAASLFLVAYVAFTRLDAAFGCSALFGTILLFVPGCTYQSNFTYVAGILVFAGGLALLCSLGGARHSGWLVAAGCAFMLAGALWRENIFLLAIPVVGVAALAVALLAGCGRDASGPAARHGESARASAASSLARLWPFLVVLVCAVGLHAYNAHAWNADPWQEWYAFNEARSDIADYSYESYSQMESELQALGVSENDYRLLKSWTTEDPGFFTVERMEAVRDVATAQRSDVYRIAAVIPAYVASSASSLRLVALVVLLVLCTALRLEHRYRATAFGVLALALVVGVALFAFGRLPARVHLPLWMFAAAGVCALSAPRARLAGNLEAGAAAEGPQPKRALARGVALAACALAFASSVVFVAGVGATHARVDRVAPLVDAASFEPESVLLDYMREHPDNVFVLNIAANAELVYANLMMAPLDHETIMQTTSLGGWAAHAPYAFARNAQIGMESPVKGLVDNPRALLVCGDSSSADMLRTYLREHYYPHATYVEVDSVAVNSGSGTLRFYRFSRS